MAGAVIVPSRAELEALFEQKHGPADRLGWSPARRRRFGYFLPSDVYEATVNRAVGEGCAWLDVGGGHNIFPENPALADALVSRCSTVVAVDPSANVHDNRFVQERVQAFIEDYRTDRQFDLATLRMVVEHVEEPDRVVGALRQLVKAGGRVIVLTVNLSAPITIASRFTPFSVHAGLKRLLWGGEDKDTFPVRYKMNTRKTLRRLFESHGFREAAFSYIDDLSAFGQFRTLNYLELMAWAGLRRLGIRYPENCLLGVYEKGPN